MMDSGHALGLLVALMIGAVVGLERGWRLRQYGEGRRVAGLRTFALMGLAGGVAGLVGERAGAWVVPVALAGVIALLVLGYRRSAWRQDDMGITTEVAGVLVFLLGVLATAGQALLALAGGVVTAVVLGFKPRLHAFLVWLDGPEIRAILQLALISAVLLPLLPRSGYGPWNVLNPYQIWLMVVLISAIGFVGHFAVRIVGSRRGVLFTGLFAGLASSTALTLTLSRAARQQRSLQPLFAAAIVLACTTMFPRLLVLVAAVAPGLLAGLYLPVAILTAVGLTATAGLVIESGHGQDNAWSPALQTPFELGTALRFGVILVVVMLGAEALRRLAGDAGVYLMALLSGLTDVDAITLSLGNMAGEQLGAAVALQGILIAAMANTLVKMGLAIGLGGRGLALRVGLGLGAVIVAGALWVVSGGLR
ncbi:MgtC/SapB family protein [Spiribacter pallidus]|uniref:MgtC/SapB family protein n=1 Tax=Spiribacter pallidus TaxID=1987936 RepID=UPI00349FBA22